jgi:hypothetical protein
MKKKILMLCTAMVAFVLEIIPYGAVCNFANPEGKPWRRTYSYFDLTPFGYANFAPFIVAILTCALIIMIVVSIVIKKPMKTPILAVSVISTVLSFAPLLYGISYFSVVGAFISLALLVTAIISFIRN